VPPLPGDAARNGVLFNMQKVFELTRTASNKSRGRGFSDFSRGAN